MKAPTPVSRALGLIVLVLAQVTGLAPTVRSATAPAPSHSSLVIVIDGLRPDYITKEIMPNLLGLGEAGVVADAHHSVYPTVTRVNASSMATGAYPRVHGLMHNTIYLPAVSPSAIDTADAEAMLSADAGTGGHLLTAVTLGELLAQAGRKMMVASSGTTGASILLNPKKFNEGALLNSRGLVLPETLRARAGNVLGPVPKSTEPSWAGHHWAVDAYLEISLKEIHPDVAFLWLSDPDTTAHRTGVGSPETIEALRHVDAEVGRLLGALAQRGLRDHINILVTADHGFSTQAGPFNVNALLKARGLADDVLVIGGNQIYVKSGGDEKIRSIVRALQATDWVGAIFTHAPTFGAREGMAPGTLPFDVINYQHPRAADILVDANWSDAVNKYGYAGATTTGGVAGHGASSPYDVHIRLIASGPDFKRGVKSSVPTGNIDLAPTLCQLQGITPAPSMMGRVLTELLRDGPAPESVRTETSVVRAATEWPGGRYGVELHKVRVGTTEYVDYTRTQR